MIRSSTVPRRLAKLLAAFIDGTAGLAKLLAAFIDGMAGVLEWQLLSRFAATSARSQ
jgi:hypothetical protein